MQTLQVLKTETIVPATQETQPTWKNLSLMERSKLFFQAMQYLDEETTAEEFDLIADTEQALKDKLLACAHVSQKYDQAAELILSEAQALKGQMKSLEERANVFMNRSQSRREAMLQAMLINNIRKIEAPLLTVGLRQKPPRVIETEFVPMELTDLNEVLSFFLEGSKLLIEARDQNFDVDLLKDGFEAIEDALSSYKLKLHPDYVRIKAEWNKKKIAEELKEGKAVEGFRMSPPEFSLIIK